MASAWACCEFATATVAWVLTHATLIERHVNDSWNLKVVSHGSQCVALGKVYGKQQRATLESVSQRDSLPSISGRAY